VQKFVSKNVSKKNMEEEMAKLDEMSNEEGLKYHKV